MAPPSALRPWLESVYRERHRSELVSPDPLEFVVGFRDVQDREIAGLVASSLAFGSVGSIGRAVAGVLRHLPQPRECLLHTPPRRFKAALTDWRHRWVTGQDMCDLLAGIRAALERHGSLEGAFLHWFREDDATVVPALTTFVDEVRAGMRRPKNYLLPSPRGGSACKRLNLFLRWMARSDTVDPGGWTRVPPSRLVVPLDVHMHRIALRLGLTRRKQPDLRTALEVTEAFRAIAPDDPVRYDFALTRLGIRKRLPPHA